MKSIGKKGMITGISLAAFIGVGSALAGSSLEDKVVALAQTLKLFETSIHPTLEKREVNESASITESALYMFRIQMKTEPDHRDAHAKGAGCAYGSFKVEPSIPKDLAKGLFRPGQTYDLLVRFSNGAGLSRPDFVPDARGMAFKLISAADGGNLLGNGNNQDFLLVNQPHFFLGSAKTYGRFQRVNFEDGNPGRFFMERAIFEAFNQVPGLDVSLLTDDSLRPLIGAIVNKVGPQQQPSPEAIGAELEKLFPGKGKDVLPVLAAKLAELQARKAPLELKLALEALGRTTSKLNQVYTSMTSFLLSDRPGSATDLGVKWITKPVDCATGNLIAADSNIGATPSENLLRERLDRELAGGSRCFGFYIQTLPTSASAAEKINLVEDARLDFNTTATLVARIELPQQQTNLSSKLQYCERLSFNPWQSRPEHQPLGALNRARKAAVTMSSIRRHFVTNSDRFEPRSIDDFKNLK